MKWMSQLDLCVNSYSLKVQQWSSNTKQNSRSHFLNSEVQSALYKHSVSEIHLDSYMLFFSFFS